MANPNIPRVYNLNMERVAFLDKAYNIGYELKLNELWTASFSLPSDDPKNAYCKPFSYCPSFLTGYNRSFCKWKYAKFPLQCRCTEKTCRQRVASGR